MARSAHRGKRIVSGTIRRYPFRFAVGCGQRMIQQLVSFKAGEGSGAPMAYNAQVIDSLYPGDTLKFRLTRQWFNALAGDARKLSIVYTLVFWCSASVGLALFLKRRSTPRNADRLFLLASIFLVSNALVTGALSKVTARYQCRVAWLIPLCFAAYILPWIMKGRDYRRSSSP